MSDLDAGDHGRGLDSGQAVVLNYIDKTHDAFVAARSYTNRLLIVLVVVSLLVIAIAGGAVTGNKLSFGGSDFEIDVWAFLLAGAVFVSIAPGWIIGRLNYAAKLSREIDRLYDEIAPSVPLRTKGVYPFEVAAFIAEASSAGDRLVSASGRFASWLRPSSEPDPQSATNSSEKRWWKIAMIAMDLVGLLTFLLVFALLPVAAQVFALVAVTDDRPIVGGLIGLLAAFTLASVAVAGIRWLTSERTGT